MSKPLDRAYFEKKKNPKYDDKNAVTECCGETKNRDHMMKGNKEDWKLIENHIEEHLRMYSNVVSVTPIFCDVCGRFKQYLSKLDVDKTKGYRKKNASN
jgi:hypothetical protein